MIVLKQLKWSNCFSYGKGNSIDFTSNPITQLVGSNGNGKSSIPLILELVLFNKNSKGIKTADIINRYIDDNYYSISLSFSNGEDEYFIETKRTSTQTVKISKNGTDISAHTPTATFKIIESILGFDHKAFVQLIYQSSAQSLEFLTATDTNRKKFLIDLLNLDKYTKAFDIFKAVTKDVQTDVTKAETAISVITSWLDKHSKADLVLKPVSTIPPPPTDLVEKRIKISEDLKKIEATNKTIQTNNTYKDILNSIDLTALPVVNKYEDESDLVKQKTEAEKELKDATLFITKVKALKSNCPTCNHPLDNSKQLELLEGQEVIKITAAESARILSEKISIILNNNKLITQNDSTISRWEQYNSLYDASINSQKLDKNDLDDRVIALTSTIEKQEKEIATIIKANQLADSHNSKVAVLLEQLEEMRVDLTINKVVLAKVTERLTTLQILQKAFSTNGLIAFKIESMIKDLEDLINEYLAELSYGRFQLTFSIVGEKLNVVISDNCREVDMLALSSGEKARVNTATLLAIRKLMQNLSNTKVNLLILDETIDNLDVEGKEKLVELLVKEEHLNTFLISHGYSHPLLEKISIIKVDNISRIEV